MRCVVVACSRISQPNDDGRRLVRDPGVDVGGAGLRFGGGLRGIRLRRNVQEAAFVAEVSAATSRAPACDPARAREDQALEVVGADRPLQKDEVARLEKAAQEARGVSDRGKREQGVLCAPLGAQAGRGSRSREHDAVGHRERLPCDLHVAGCIGSGVIRHRSDHDDLPLGTGDAHEIERGADAPVRRLPVVADERHAIGQLHGTHPSFEGLDASDGVGRGGERHAQRNGSRQGRQDHRHPVDAAEARAHASGLALPSDGEGKAIGPCGLDGLAAQHRVVSQAVGHRAAGELRSHREHARIVRIEDGDSVDRQRPHELALLLRDAIEAPVCGRVVTADVGHDAHRGTKERERQVDAGLVRDGDLRHAIRVRAAHAQQQASHVVRAVERALSLAALRQMALEDDGDQVLGRRLAATSRDADERRPAQRCTAQVGEPIRY